MNRARLESQVEFELEHDVSLGAGGCGGFLQHLEIGFQCDQRRQLQHVDSLRGRIHCCRKRCCWRWRAGSKRTPFRANRWTDRGTVLPLAAAPGGELPRRLRPEAPLTVTAVPPTPKRLQTNQTGIVCRGAVEGWTPRPACDATHGWRQRLESMTPAPRPSTSPGVQPNSRR